MKNQKGQILPILLLILVAVAIGGYFYFNNTVKLYTPPVVTETKTTENPSSNAKISITTTGIVPASLTVAKGQQVTWVNMDAKTHHLVPVGSTSSALMANFDSDPLEKNDEYSFTFENTGEYHYQDSSTGSTASIIVK